MEILYEDEELTVAIKPDRCSSEQLPDKSGFADLLAQRNPNRYIGVVHRLDQGVGGVMVYARTPFAAAALSKAVQNQSLQKDYLAIIHGIPKEPSAKLCDLLFHDRYKNKTFVVDRVRKGVKEAILSYEVLESLEHPEFGNLTLLSVKLYTGRTHQIRVQLSSRGYPLLGDRKYGAPSRAPIGLFSYRLSFPHPKTNRIVSLSRLPCGTTWDLFSRYDLIK